MDRHAPPLGCPRGRMRSASRGHTMIEMLIVLTLMAALAGIAMPRLDYVGMRLDGNARAVRGVLQQAWRLSIQKQHDVIVNFDVAGGRLRIVEDANNDGAASGDERIRWHPLQDGAAFGVPPLGVLGSPGTPVAGAGVRNLESMPSVTYRRNGSTSGDIELFLRASHHGATYWRAITVAQGTGRAEWFRLVNGTWKSGGM
jgi:prepilin-type N-terminal cleavage/methylation domain-containing protein